MRNPDSDTKLDQGTTGYRAVIEREDYGDVAGYPERCPAKLGIACYFQDAQYQVSG